MKMDRFVHEHKKVILVVAITLFAGFFGGYTYGRYAERTAHESDHAHNHDTGHHAHGPSDASHNADGYHQ